ncbi:MAG: STAS domain-containing protein [Desulfobacteraceae bacterium]|nr:STAS domain-containing protein [Desulfobacteraceae bacterium]
MELTVDQGQTSARITIKGEIDGPGAEKLKAGFHALDKTLLKSIVLDFNGVTHIGSAGIGKLLLFYKDIAIGGGSMEIVHVPAPIYDLLLTLKLDSVFKIQKA